MPEISFDFNEQPLRRAEPAMAPINAVRVRFLGADIGLRIVADTLSRSLEGYSSSGGSPHR